MKRLLLFLTGLLLFISTVLTSAQAIERRKPQFLDEPSYLVAPLYYDIPGIGSGPMGIGLLGNFLGSYLDVYAVALGGDAQGRILGIEDIHLISETLILNLGYMSLDKAAVQIYEKRGMDTHKDDYYLVEVNKVDGTDATIMLSLWDRRLVLFGSTFKQAVNIVRIYDPEGEILAEYTEKQGVEFENRNAGVLLDYTDDWQDPRKGVRAKVSRSISPRTNNDEPDFFSVDISLGFYLPIGKSSTWAFNYYTSDAVVTSEGMTDLDTIRQEISTDLNCPLQVPECAYLVESQAEITYAARKYGTSAALGGQNRMRAYPEGRFQAAHTLYYSTEFRWNYSDDVTPFDFWIWKDVSTGFQLAMFYEVGSTEDKKEDLSSTLRSSYGAGLRMVSASGYVYRGDIAYGDEGSQTTFIFNYPW